MNDKRFCCVENRLGHQAADCLSIEAKHMYFLQWNSPFDLWFFNVCLHGRMASVRLHSIVSDYSIFHRKPLVAKHHKSYKRMRLISLLKQLMNECPLAAWTVTVCVCVSESALELKSRTKINCILHLPF